MAPSLELVLPSSCGDGSALLMQYFYCSLTPLSEQFETQIWFCFVIEIVCLCESANCVDVCVSEVAPFGLLALLGIISLIVCAGEVALVELLALVGDSSSFVSCGGLVGFSENMIFEMFKFFRWILFSPVRP